MKLRGLGLQYLMRGMVGALQQPVVVLRVFAGRMNVEEVVVMLYFRDVLR